jgi:hypothetical protein
MSPRTVFAGIGIAALWVAFLLFAHRQRRRICPWCAAPAGEPHHERCRRPRKEGDDA